MPKNCWKFTLLGISLWQLLSQVSCNPFNHGNNHMKQILESHWQTKGTGRLLNGSALQKEKLLRVSSSSCPLRRSEDTVLTSNWEWDKGWWSPSMGGTWVLVDESVPVKRSYLRGITVGCPEGGWAIRPGLSSLGRDSVASTVICGLN